MSPTEDRMFPGLYLYDFMRYKNKSNISNLRKSFFISYDLWQIRKMKQNSFQLGKWLIGLCLTVFKHKKTMRYYRYIKFKYIITLLIN